MASMSPKAIWVVLRETSKWAPTRKSWPRSRLMKMVLMLSVYYHRHLEGRVGRKSITLMVRPTVSCPPRCLNHLKWEKTQRSRMESWCQMLTIKLQGPTTWSNLRNPNHQNTSSKDRLKLLLQRTDPGSFPLRAFQKEPQLLPIQILREMID